jgi:eukaryotic-like serine/threonine-protein kinase
MDLLGEGGMGVVYKAYDPELDRRVAVKRLRAARSDQTRTRFLREAQALARVSHPNIVSVYDVGTFEGDVFIAMELVEGKTLRRWLREDAPSPTRVLPVLIAAGHGLAAAHRAGLIHRDFKPDNLIVGNDGRGRVLDFGLARLKDAEQAAEHDRASEAPPLDPESSTSGERLLASPLTRAGTIMGTPAYMAPEQIRGEEVTERTDQFAFCVVLHEALFGQRPFVGATLEAVEAAVLAGRVSTPPTEGSVPARLRALVLRGLLTDPAARWPSMEALLAELERDPRAAFRRAAVTGSLIALAGLAALGFTRQRGESVRLCAGAEQKLAGVWDAPTKDKVRTAFIATGRTYAADTFRRVEKVLDDYARAWSGMRREACEATHVLGEQSPQVLDLRVRCLDRRLEELGALMTLFTQAPGGDVLDRAVPASSNLTGLAGCADKEALTAAIPPPDDPVKRARVEALQRQLDRAEALLKAGRFGDGQKAAAAIVGEVRTLGYAPLLARVLFALGSLEQRSEHPDRAPELLREAALTAARAKDDALVARAWTELMFVDTDALGKPAEALALRDAAESAIVRAGDDPKLRWRLVSVEATTLAAQGKMPAALESDQRALALAEQAFGRDQLEVANQLHNLGTTLRTNGKYAAAVQALEKAVAIEEKLLGPDHPDVADSLNSLSNVLDDQGNHAASQRTMERALGIWERALGAGHPRIAAGLINLGSTLTAEGDYDGARRSLERARDVAEKALGSEHPWVAHALTELGSALRAMQRFDEARADIGRAIAIWTKTQGPESPLLAVPLFDLGQVALDERAFAEACRHYQRALTIVEKANGPTHTDVAAALTGLGRCDLGLNRARAARDALERALKIREPAGGDPLALARTRFALAEALAQTGGDRTRARTLAQQARDAFAGGGAQARAELQHADAWLRER